MGRDDDAEAGVGASVVPPRDWIAAGGANAGSQRVRRE